MGISDVRSLVDVQDGASEIVLMAPHMKYTDQLASLANAVLSGIEGQGLAVHRWEKLNSQLFDFLRLDFRLGRGETGGEAGGEAGGLSNCSKSFSSKRSIKESLVPKQTRKEK